MFKTFLKATAPRLEHLRVNVFGCQFTFQFDDGKRPDVILAGDPLYRPPLNAQLYDWNLSFALRVLDLYWRIVIVITGSGFIGLRDANTYILYTYLNSNILLSFKVNLLKLLFP